MHNLKTREQDMKTNVRFLLCAATALLAVSCGSRKDGSAPSPGGPMMMMDPNAPVNVEIAVTEYRDVNQPFTVVSMFNNVNVKLVHDRHPHLELTCPKNLIEKVTTEVNNDTLVIRNENNFNWIRSFDYSSTF